MLLLNRTLSVVAILASLLLLAACSTALNDLEAEAKPERGNVTVNPDPAEFGSMAVATANPGGPVWIHAECYQDGELVYAQYKKVDENNQAMLTLGPTPSWSGGDAECIAEEGTWGKNGRFRVIASTDFQVIDSN